eukprot:s1373_g5.t1
MTVAELKTKLTEWHADLKSFNKAKNKEDKKQIVLQTWFKKFVVPEITSSKPQKDTKGQSATASKAKQIEEALAFTAEVSTEESEEKPEYLAKILLLQKEWLGKIIDGSKTLELRKTTLSSSPTSESMFLAVKSTIYARCMISHSLTICNLDEFEKLMPAHQCPEPPYTFPFVAHRVSKVQALKPIEFLKLDSCIGRSLYRPLGWTADSGEPGTPQPDTEEPAAGAEIEKDEAEKGVKFKGKKLKSQSKKGCTAKEKHDAKSKHSSKTSKPSSGKKPTCKSSLQLGEGDLLDSQHVKVVSHQDHLQASKARLEKKVKFLARKDAATVLQISGGLLSHLNNEAFQTDGLTLAFLVGTFASDGKVDVRGMWCDRVENVYASQWDNADLRAFCEKKSMEIVGTCVVKPCSDATLTSEDLAMAKKHQTECSPAFVTAITGSDRMTSFFRISPELLEAAEVTVEQVCEISPKVLWVGKGSLYFVHFTWEISATANLVGEAGKASMAKNKKVKRQEKKPEPREGFHDAKAVAHLGQIGGELGEIANYLCLRLPDFASDLDAQQRLSFEKDLEKWPLGLEELRKTKLNKCPDDIGEAGRMLSAEPKPEGEQLQVVPARDNGESAEEKEASGEGEKDDKLKRCGAKVRVRYSIYQKLQVIREVDRLLEAGQKHGVEKKVMQTFPHIFMGTKGSNKSGMLGRWLVQCDEQRWREIPFEKMSQEDRQVKELPDWIRIAFGMPPRNMERFKEGTHMPPVIVKSIVSMVERLTCGGDTSRQTSGTVDVKDIKQEAERLLKIYQEAQQKEAEAKGFDIPEQKCEVSTRWVNRILQHYGWKRKDARADNIEQGRHSITVVTSLWASGECGPLCIVLPLGFLNDEELGMLQQKYAPDVYFISSKSTSHFMTAETVVTYFDEITPDCEAFAHEDFELHESVDQLLEKPDINRTVFLWQIESNLAEEDVEDWEKEETSWCCLPGHWQQMLNAKLSEHHSFVQDAENDVKTKNALQKYQRAQNGEGSVSVILISKSTGKEMSQKVYQRCVIQKDGEFQVAVSQHVVAFKLNMKDLTLEELSSPPVTRNLRIVSVTGRSREIQEVRLHLNLLSLNQSHLMGQGSFGECNAASSSSSSKDVSNQKEGQKEEQDGIDKEGQKEEQDGIDKELAAPDQGECDMENAEDGMVVDDHAQDGQPNAEEADLEELFGPMEIEESFDFSDETVWKVGDGVSFVVSQEDLPLDENSIDPPQKPVAKAISGDRFKDVPAFQFLEKIHLTELPNIPGTGIGIHHTTNTWQVRYPAATKQSVARTFGHTKKGFVYPVQALLECLLWAWQQHLEKNPLCATSKERIQVIQGALKVNLGHDVA